MRRRRNTELAVSRTPILQPLGEHRERFYEQRLLLGLPWYCIEHPWKESGGVTWLIRAALDELGLGEAQLPPVEILLGPTRALSFEAECKKLEEEYCKPEHGLVCSCRAHEAHGSPCPSCRFAVGFHSCRLRPEQ